MLNVPFSFDRKLDIIPVSASNEPHPLDLLHRIRRNVPCADHPQSPDGASIGEGDMLAIGIQLPPRRLVLDAAVIMLKVRIAFLALDVIFAILIKTRDSEPCSLRTGLTGL